MSPLDPVVPPFEPAIPPIPPPENSRSGGTLESPADPEGPVPEVPTAEATDPGADSELPGLAAFGQARLGRPRPGKRLVKPDEKAPPVTAEQRLLLLDTWQRSGLPAGDFAALVGLSKHTLYSWKKKFDAEGPGGLVDRPRGGPSGSRLPDLTKRSILLMKHAHPDWGVRRISDLLARGPGLPASPAAVARVLHEAGYELEEVATRPHPDHVRHFERARPNELWQTDLFTFVLKRQNRRMHLVAFLDDHSRFIVGYGLHASQSTALVLEVVRAAVASYGVPQEVLTDNGAQYVTWRGTSAFTKELNRLGIQQIVAKPRRPQTLGKIERFWGSLWRECVERAVFLDLGDAQRRIGLFIDYYNFQRPHQGAGGLVPADRFFGAAPEVLKTLKARVAANALELARHGRPAAPFYLTGQVGGQAFSVHAEGERVILTGADGRREIDLVAPAAVGGTPPAAATPAPATPGPIVGDAWPEPLCPAGVVAGGTAEGSETEPALGTSALDALLSDLQTEGPADRAGPTPASKGGEA